MKTILNKGQEAAESGFALGALGDIAKVLPVIGVGSKARQEEAAANATAQQQVIEANAKADAKKSNTYVIIGALVGVFLIVGITIYFTLKK